MISKIERCDVSLPAYTTTCIAEFCADIAQQVDFDE